jgi:hypothetical protein
MFFNVLVSFLIADQKEERKELLILTHSFRGFSLRLFGPVYLGRTSWQPEHVAEDIFTSWWTGSREQEMIKAHPQ